MKKIKRRAYAALLLALALLLGLGLFVWRYATQGRRWVSFTANQHLYTNGTLSAGTLTDRYNTVLADAQEGKWVFAEDAGIRTACLHAVGDGHGNIGTGALSAFADLLTGYSLVTGVSEHGGAAALSIDAQLCATAYEALNGRRGTVLMADYTTGQILCMTSSPSYDPTVGFDSGNSYYDGVYLNRGLSGTYTPGSVFKLVTLAAAIDRLPDLDDRTFSCAGSVNVGGVQVNCTGVHGNQTIEQALANSCNCAFAELSLTLGGETLDTYARRFGLTERLGLNGIQTAAGLFEVAEADSADLAWSGIGQYTDLVCPATMLRYICAIANGGTAHELSLLRGYRGGSEQLLDRDTADKLKAMMSYNVVYAYGSENFPGLNLCAKTGTAEVGDGSSHAWFAGFLDDSAHPYAFVVLIENGGGGLRNAGPVANTVLQAAVSGNAGG